MKFSAATFVRNVSYLPTSMSPVRSPLPKSSISAMTPCNVYLYCRLCFFNMFSIIHETNMQFVSCTEPPRHMHTNDIWSLNLP